MRISIYSLAQPTFVYVPMKVCWSIRHMPLYARHGGELRLREECGILGDSACSAFSRWSSWPDLSDLAVMTQFSPNSQISL